MDPRYSPHWHSRRKLATAITANRCCRCGVPAAEVHHAYYTPHRAEIPLWQVFPLCKPCHGFAHRAEHYREHGDSTRNRNTTRMLWALRMMALWRVLWVWVLFWVLTGLAIRVLLLVLHR